MQLARSTGCAAQRVRDSTYRRRMLPPPKVYGSHRPTMRHITAAAANGRLATDGGATEHPREQLLSSKTRQATRAERLSWVPRLAWFEEVCSVLVSAGLCALTYMLTAPPSFSVAYAAGMAILCAALIWAIRSVLMERQYQAMARQISDLGDRDSLFLRLGDLEVHAKANASEGLMRRLEGLLKRSQHLPANPAATSTSRQAPADPAAKATAVQGPVTAKEPVARDSESQPLEVFAMHCFHGFGANLYSYAPVQAGLARAVDGLVTSHDMPGFGLTERPSSTASYFLSFNGQLGSQLIDKELNRVVEQCEAKVHPAAIPGPDQQGPDTATQAPGQNQGLNMLNAPLGPASAAPKAPGGPEGGVLAPVKVGARSMDGGPGQQRGAWGEGREADGLVRAPSPVSVLQAQPSTDTDSAMDMDFLEDVALPGSTTKAVSGLLQPQPRPSVDVSASQAAAGPCLLVKKVLIGHSLGGICAALAALDQPEACAALVLVAPAIMALPDTQFPLTELQPMPISASPQGPHSHPITLDDDSDGERVPAGPPGAGTQQGSKSGTEPVGSRRGSLSLPPGLVDRYLCPEDGGKKVATEQPTASGKGGGLWGRLLRVVQAVGQALLLLVGLLVLTAFKPAIVALLRTLVRSKTFWQRGLQQAYYNPGQVTDEVVDAYRLPQLVRGWESGMFMFLTARLAGTVDLRAVGDRITGLMSSVEQEVAEDMGLAKRLGELVRKHRTPILIIHGVHDRLVPASNSRRLATMLPGCELALMQRCGHMPQEEWPQPFIELVREFVTRRPTTGVKMAL